MHHTPVCVCCQANRGWYTDVCGICVAAGHLDVSEGGVSMVLCHRQATVLADAAADSDLTDLTDPDAAAEWVADLYPELGWLAALKPAAKGFYRTEPARGYLMSLYANVSRLAWEALLT